VLLELAALWLVTLLLIRGVVMAQAAGLHPWSLALVPCLFIYAPVALCHLRRVDSFAYRLFIPMFSDRTAWGQALRLSLGICAVIAVPWLIGYHIYQVHVFPEVLSWFGLEWGTPGFSGARLVPPMPEGVWAERMTEDWHGLAATVRWLNGYGTLLAYHVFFVAIPEEFFYRGYFQTRLNEVFPRKFVLFGVSFGHGIWIAALFFAFGHSLVQFQWWHFFTFFPGLAFGLLRERTGVVIAGALFHAFCNVAVGLMDISYGIAPWPF
jgi:membrane protease YdiL (CAAX protease family)